MKIERYNKTEIHLAKTEFDKILKDAFDITVELTYEVVEDEHSLNGEYQIVGFHIWAEEEQGEGEQNSFVSSRFVECEAKEAEAVEATPAR